MEEVKTVYTCPLGSTCKKVVDDHMEVCMWLVTVKGEDPQTGEKIDKDNCAMSWQPILMVENSKETRSVGDSLISLRNETVKRQDKALGMVTGLEKDIANN